MGDTDNDNSNGNNPVHTIYDGVSWMGDIVECKVLIIDPVYSIKDREIADNMRDYWKHQLSGAESND